MFWNITADNWALLWSAVIGAIIAGGSAAAVAMVVLRKTNKHQTLQADRELAFQKAQADAALAREQESSRQNAISQQHSNFLARVEQRSQLDRQIREQRQLAQKALDEQRASLEKQLKEQRQEAWKARVHAAIADLLDATLAMNMKCNAGDRDIQVEFSRMRNAIIRWGIDNSSEELAAEAIEWVLHINTLATKSLDANGARDRTARLEPLRAFGSAFVAVWLEYANASERQREENWQWIRLLAEEGDKLTDARARSLRDVAKAEVRSERS